MAKNVSNNFKNIIKNGGPFYSYAVMTLADGTVIELSSENDFTISGNPRSGSETISTSFTVPVNLILMLFFDNT